MADNNIVGAELTMSLDAAKILVMCGLAGKAPRVNATNNHWEVYDNDTQAWIDTGVNATGADGEDGHSPFLNSNGVWMVWDDTTGAYVNTGLHAKGQDGKNGYSPYINTQTNTWMYYDDATEEWYDSNVDATGPQGAPGTPGTNGTDGYSPAVTITTITGGHRVTITDKDHPTGQSFDVMDGEDGVGADSVVYLGYDSQFDDDPSIVITSSNPSYTTAATIAPALANTTLRNVRFEDDYTFDVYDLVGYSNANPATLTFACVQNNAIKFCTMTGTSGKPVYSSVPISADTEFLTAAEIDTLWGSIDGLPNGDEVSY